MSNADFRWNVAFVVAVALLATIVVILAARGCPPQPAPNPPPPPPQRQVIAVVTETANLPKLTPGQQAIAASAVLRERLTQKGVVHRGTFDIDAVGVDSPADVQEAVRNLSRQALPALLVWRDGKLSIYPLPSDETALLKLLGL